jgi:hypothetical protein
MPTPRLTKKQRLLVVEVRSLLKELHLDPDEIVSTTQSDVRTASLENARIKIIRFHVLTNYLLMEEQLSLVIRSHFFGKDRLIPQLMKLKRFRTFNYFIMERLFLLQKLDFIKNIHSIPKWVVSDLAALNDLRNGMAHSWFLYLRRRKPEWKGQSIFIRSNFDRFSADMKKLWEFFLKFWPRA